MAVDSQKLRFGCLSSCDIESQKQSGCSICASIAQWWSIDFVQAYSTGEIFPTGLTPVKCLGLLSCDGRYHHNRSTQNTLHARGMVVSYAFALVADDGSKVASSILAGGFPFL